MQGVSCVGSKACLVIVDAQRGVFDRKQPVFDAPSLVERLVRLIDAAEAKGNLVVLLQHQNRTFLVPGTAGWEIVADVAAAGRTATVLAKTKPSVFQETGLMELLAVEGIEQVYIAGLVSNGCVRDSCVDGLRQGFRISLISDAHSTFFQHAVRIIAEVNAELAALGVTLVTTDEFTALPEEQAQGRQPPAAHR